MPQKNSSHTINKKSSYQVYRYHRENTKGNSLPQNSCFDTTCNLFITEIKEASENCRRKYYAPQK
jgi:hypothetical protein